MKKQTQCSLKLILLTIQLFSNDFFFFIQISMCLQQLLRIISNKSQKWFPKSQGIYVSTNRFFLFLLETSKWSFKTIRNCTEMQNNYMNDKSKQLTILIQDNKNEIIHIGFHTYQQGSQFYQLEHQQNHLQQVLAPLASSFSSSLKDQKELTALHWSDTELEWLLTLDTLYETSSPPITRPKLNKMYCVTKRATYKLLTSLIRHLVNHTVLGHQLKFKVEFIIWQYLHETLQITDHYGIPLPPKRSEITYISNVILNLLFHLILVFLLRHDCN